MRVALTIIGVIAAVLMIVVSAAMNFLFMKSFGKSAAEGLALGGVSVAADLLKVSLPFTIAAAWRRRHIMFVILGSIAFVLFTAFSLASALGFTAEARQSSRGTRQSINTELRQIDERVRQTRSQLLQLVPHRSPSIVESELKRLQQSIRWDSSKGCTDATAAASREFCDGYFKLKGEQAAGLEASRLATAIEDLEVRSKELRTAGAGRDEDPQVGLLAKLLRADRSMIENGLIIGAALLVELGSGLGLWFALGGRHGPRTALRPHQTATEEGSGLAVARPVALAAPLTDAMPLALQPQDPQPIVERYCVARLVPVERQGLTVGALYEDFEVWRSQTRAPAIDEHAFAAAFANIATIIGIERDGDRYVGIATGPAPLLDVFPTKSSA